MKPGTTARSFISKKGSDVEIRYPTESDFHAIWGFACSLVEEDTFVGINKKPTEPEERKWLADTLEQIKKGEKIHLEMYVNGAYAGNGYVERGKFRRNHVGYLGVSVSSDYRGEGLGTVLMTTLIDEARKLGLRLLTLSCFENNERALHVYEKLGFVRSGVTPGAIAFKGAYIGEVHYYLPLEV